MYRKHLELVELPENAMAARTRAARARRLAVLERIPVTLHIQHERRSWYRP